MAGRNVWRSFHRVCLKSRSGLMPIARGAKAAMQQNKKPAWLLAAAPFVWNPPSVVEDEEYEDDEDDDEEEEEEESLNTVMMKNWSANAESHPGYRKTVDEARRILQTPPPAPPQFPEFPQGFCVDPDKVPPVPPMLPRLKHLEFHDDNKNNSKKLPSTCPQKPVPIAEAAACPAQHLHITPKMPDLPFCDRPIPPPALPMPPPCGELGPPPPPPRDPPKLLARVEKAPPPLPAPPPMYYDLPPPPSVFEPHSKGKIPPLPCLPEKLNEASMVKCSNENNDTLGSYCAFAMQGAVERSNNNAATLPPPPPMLSADSISTTSYWRDDSQLGMIAAPAQKPKLRKKKRKGKTIANDSTAAEETAEAATAEEIQPEYVTQSGPANGEEHEQFEVLWSSRGRMGR